MKPSTATKYLLTVYIIFFSLSNIIAQNQDFQDRNWYYGNSSSGLTFSKGNSAPSLVQDQAEPFGTGGSAVATDPQSGELLFYTDGLNVYDRTHQLMPNGGGLNATAGANQPVAILPVPGEAEQYYIITNTADGATPGDLFYSIVDLSLPGNAGDDEPPTDDDEPPRGDVTTAKNVNTGIGNTSEAMIAFHTGTDPYQYWILVQSHGTNEFRLFEATPGNVFTPATPTTTIPFSMTAGNFALHRPTGKIAVSPQNPGTNVTLLDIDFDNATLAYDTVILNTGNNDGGAYAIYDTEWSNDGTKLFVSRTGAGGNPGTVTRYDLNNPQASGELITAAPPLFASYGLRRGPDGQIYHLYQETAGGPFLIGRINGPDSVITSLQYEPLPFGNVDFGGRQFPEFSPNLSVEFLSAGISVLGTCMGNPTKFFPAIDPTAESYTWDFGDGTSETYNSFVAPIHQYEAGTYTVELEARINGQDTTISQTVTIVQSDSVDLGQDTVICPGEQLTLDAGPGGQSYVWSVPGETGQTITVDSAGTYWVVVDYGGCTSYDEIMVEVYGEQTQFANFWYFGNDAGIDFNDGATAVTGNSQALAGVATISDANGDLVFYTDGNTVYDRDKNPRASNIGGDKTATQSSLIIPFPNDPTMFYIFTTEDIYDGLGEHKYRLGYAIYDMKELVAGPVVLDTLTLYEGTTERLAGIVGGGGSWMLSHEFGTNTFRAYPITQDGIGNPVLSSVGSVHGTGSAASSEGYMQFSPDGQKVAVAFVNSSGENIVEVFDFDQTTGELSNPIQLTFDETFPLSQVYGLVFSPGGGNLYVSLTGTTSQLYEFKLYNDQQDSIQNSRTLLEEADAEFGALQAGPDGQIYMAVKGADFLVTFGPNEDSVQNASVDFGSSRFQLAGGTTSELGLPNFAQNTGTAGGAPGMLVTDGCLGTPSDFQATPSSMIDEFFWDYEEGTSTMQQFQHTFDSAGAYNIELRISNRCGLDTLFQQTININVSPEPTLPPADIICSGALILDADTNNVGGLSFAWSTGDTTKTASITQPSTVSVTVTDQNGCQAQDTTEVYDGRPPVELGPDLTICQDDSVGPLDAGNPSQGTTYAWTINGAAAGSGRFQNVDTSVPGTYNYKVAINDGLTGCIGMDSVLITVNPTPSQPTYVVTEPSACSDDDGSIAITSPVNGLTVEWYDENNALVGSSPTLSDISAGVYTLQLIDNLSGCTYSEAVTVTDLTVLFTISATPGLDCEVDTVNVSLAGVTDVNTISYTLSNVDGTNNISGSPSPATSDFAILPVPTGNYYLTVSADGCTDTANVSVAPNNSVSLQVDPQFDLCSESALISANTNGSGIDWFKPVSNLVGSTTSGQDFDAEPHGSGTYTVIARGDGVNTCDTTTTIQVNINESPEVEVVEVDDGCDGEAILQANITSNGSGNYTYNWTSGEQTPRIFVTASGDYEVTVYDRNGGCSGTANATATVLSPQNITLELDTIPCQNGQSLTITAVSTQPGDSYAWYQNDVLLQTQTTNSVETFSEGFFRAEVGISGCTYTAERNVARAPLTPSNIEPLYEICPEEPVNEIAVIEPGNFEQYFAFNIETDQQYFEASPGIFELMEEGPVRFVLINNFNCVTEDSTYIDVSCDPSIVAPNAFSPLASMAVNRTFKVWPLFVTDFEIFIYNRWGELIFHSDDLDFMVNEGWNGTKNGKPLPSGTYAYVMKFKSLTDPGRGEFEKRGGVHLLR